MKKAIITTIILASFLIVGIALARENEPGNPFDQIWETIMEVKAEIADIWEAIDEIELIPGPPGPPGDTGPAGEQGPPGPSVPHNDYEKHVLDYAQYITHDEWSYNGSEEVPIPASATVTCPVNCVLDVNFYGSVRTTEFTTIPPGAATYYIIYIDGNRTSNYILDVHKNIDDESPVSIGGIFPVSAGEHTVEIYTWQHYGNFILRIKTLTVVAFGQ